MLTKENITSVKARGFLLNKGTECFSGRVVSPGGLYSAEDLEAIALCARQFGDGTVAFTSRLCAEITGIPFAKIPLAEEFLNAHGLAFGGTGPKVRPVTACKGTTCVFGNVDTRALAKELHERFYLGMADVKLPHKFKIGVGGCPNRCMKPNLNDVGLEGRMLFTLNEEKCRGCKVCAVEVHCPLKAVSIESGKAKVNEDKCIYCGLCESKCPFGAVTDIKRVVAISVGGTWGKTARIGSELSFTVAPDQAGDLVEKILLWYKKHGFAKERLGMTVERIGAEAMERELQGDGLLKEKETILSAPLLERK